VHEPEFRTLFDAIKTDPARGLSWEEWEGLWEERGHARPKPEVPDPPRFEPPHHAATASATPAATLADVVEALPVEDTAFEAAWGEVNRIVRTEVPEHHPAAEKAPPL